MKKYQGNNKRNIINKLIRGAQAVIIAMALFLMPVQVFALTAEEELNLINQQIQNAKNKLNQTTTEKKTLQGQVNYYNGQISNIQAQINTTSSQISSLNSEITTTQERIKQAEADLNKAREQLGEIMRVSYEEGQISNIELIARSNNFSEFFDRSEYLESIQLKIKSITDEVITLKNELDAKKKKLDEDKKRAEILKTQQLAQRAEVAGQKSIKDHLLAETKGDEAAYQALVKKLQSQYDSLQRQIWSGSGNYVSLGAVKAGDIIGYIGNSGYSTGPHLHFEVRTGDCYGCHVNPSGYIGNGYFQHPAPGVYVSQYYGPANWGAYSFHTGIDYADGGRGTPVRASADGDIVVRVTGRPNTFSWSVEYGNYVKIRHTNGMYTLYGHLR